MSEASKLATLLLHLELNPSELTKYQNDPNYMRQELAHFGLSHETIDVVMSGDLEELGKVFKEIAGHLAHVGAEEQSR
jgi:hypothetical protein